MIIVKDKQKLISLVNKVIEDQDKRIRKRKESGLTEDDILMWNRIFNQPDPEPIYQDHFALSPQWKAKNRR